MKNFIECVVRPDKDMSGKLFGDLKVIKPVGKQHTKTVYECECQNCGKVLKATSCNIQRNKACGCRRGGITTHGDVGSVEYQTWNHIKNRCLNKNSSDYLNYGAKGITICDRWLKFENFIADMGVRPENKESIDRIEGDKGYYPGNCRWADRKQQNRNRRTNNFIEYRGEVKCVGEWAEILGIPSRLITKRLSRGMSVDRALKNINLATGNPISGGV